jgi:ADP-ribosylglycohydrolase
MNSDDRIRARNCIVGALVADAASMGLHWLYSQRRITELAPDTPEFREPSEADYAGGVGYFAHGTRRAGDLSHYGEQLLVMLRSLAETGGHYQQAHYQEQFRRHFGYGGEFVGYIDRPTRQTLDRIYADENMALAAVDAIPYEGDSREQQGMQTKVLAAAKRFSGQRLMDQVQSYAADMNDPEMTARYGGALVAALAGSNEFPGAADEQLPAVSKLPPLVACHVADPELLTLSASAIKVTNNTPRAVDFGMVCTALLQACIQGQSLPQAVQAGIDAGSEETSGLLNRALSMSSSVREVTREFGLHCDLGAGVPSVLSNLQTASSFTEAVRRNITAGGDNCGRAIILGAACGARFGMGGEVGIPTEWVNRVHGIDRIQADLNRLFDAA